MRTKILHITSGLEDGGAEKTLYELIKNSPQNENLVISLKDKGKYGSLFEKNGIKVFYFNFSFNLFALFKFYKLIKIITNINPDIVQTWMYHANFIGGCAAYLSNSRNIFWSVHHTSLKKNLNKKTTLIIARLNSILSYIIPKKIIYCAESAKNAHIKFGFCKNKFIVIPNGIDFLKFKKSNYQRFKYRKEIGVSKHENLFGTVARFDPNKDHISLLKSINLLRNTGLQFKYLLVGENIDYKNKILVKLIEKYNLKDIVLLLGKENRISFVMNALDLHVLSSKSEAFPLVVLEAIACDTLCISTNVGDISKIIKNKNFIIDPNNHEYLCEAIVKFNKLDYQKKKEIKKRTYKIIKNNFSINKMSKTYNKLYSKYL